MSWYVVALWSCVPSEDAAEPAEGSLMRDPGGAMWAIHPPLMTPLSTIESDVDGAQLGWAASVGDVNGDGHPDLVAGATHYTNGSPFEGGVFLSLGSESGLDPTPALIVESNQELAFFGLSVSADGDVNGDGFDDVVVGSLASHTLYLGTVSGLSTTPAWKLDAMPEFPQFASVVSSAGDVNGDGFDDVVVGDATAAGADGAAFVFLGSAAGLATTPIATLGNEPGMQQFGVSASSAGDVNGDGYDDVIVGDTVFDGPFVDGGAVFLYLGSANGVETTAAWTGFGDSSEARFGETIAPAGDVNGDGYGDIVVSNPHILPHDQGKAWVYHGSASGLEGRAAWSAKADQRLSTFGFSISSAGDVNGDGYDDLVVGAATFGKEQPDEGQVFVFLGSASGLEKEASWAWHPTDQAHAEMGVSVASGDFNGDGYSDIAGGAPGHGDVGETEEGWILVFAGRCYDDGIDADSDGIGDRCDDCVGEGCGLTITVADPGIAGQDNTWVMTNAPAGVDVEWWGGSAFGTTAGPGACGNVKLGIRSAKVLGTSATGGEGRAELVVNIPATAAGNAIHVQAILPITCTTSNISSTSFQ